MQILIAEDDIDSRILLESVLNSRDYDVLVASDGLEAWQLLESHNPDLIISDILMPIIDGFELCKKIKSEDRLKHIPIIIYSATYVEARDRQLALASGASKFLLKPIDPIEMLEEVAATLAEHPSKTAQLSDVPKDVDLLHIRVLQDKLQAKLKLLSEKNYELEEEKDLLELALDVSGMAAFRWYAETDKLIAYPNLNKLLYGNAGGVSAKLSYLLEHTHIEDRSKLASAFQNLQQSDKFISLSFRFHRPISGETQLTLNARRHSLSPNLILGTITHVDANGSGNISSMLSQREIDFAKQHDQTTGLPNRNAFINSLESAIQTHIKTSKGFTLLILDFDHFKSLNDSLGHNYGEKFVNAVCERIKQKLPSNFPLFRIGGDELAIILNEMSNTEAAHTYAQNLLPYIAQPTELNGQIFNMTASIGISQYPDHGDNSYALMTAADNALYQAKSLFGNQAIVYSTEMAKSTSERLGLGLGLISAIENNQLELHYQPQVNLSTNIVSGVEALLRWRHPSLGLVMPDRFIPIAEQNGHMIAIGRWVFRKVLTEPYIRDLAINHGVSVSINLSIRQFSDERLVDFLASLLTDTDFPAEALVIEITESTLQVAAQSVQLLKEIRKLGIKTAIDDFGTGYSSFSSLKQIKLDILKIDKMFIRDIAHSKSDYLIVQAMIKLGMALGMSTTAEGIETKEQLELLQSMGCQDYQGFYFSKAIAVNELKTLLDSKL